MSLAAGQQLAISPGLLVALEALVTHLERDVHGQPSSLRAGLLTLQQQAAPQEHLIKPAVLAAIVGLLQSGRSDTARLAAALIRGLTEAGPRARTAIREAGGINALAAVAGKVAGGGPGITRPDALAAEAAVDALRLLLAAGAPAHGSSAVSKTATEGAEYTKWRQTCSAVREAGGISSLTALTASGPDRRIARDALGVLVSMICGSDADVAPERSQNALVARKLAASEFVQAGGVRALSTILSTGGWAVQAQSAVSKALRLSKDLVLLLPAVMSAVHAWGTVATVIRLLDAGPPPALERLVREVLSAFGSVFQPEQRSDASHDGAFNLDTGPQPLSDIPSDSDAEDEGADDGSWFRVKDIGDANSDRAGKTTLHWAAQFGEVALLTQLLDCAVDADVADCAGNTPLHLAALNSQTECIRALMWAGADVMVFNGSEALPMDLATPMGDAWRLLEMELQWRSVLQAQHPCEVVWDASERPEPWQPPPSGSPGESSPLPAGFTNEHLNGGSGRHKHQTFDGASESPDRKRMSENGYGPSRTPPGSTSSTAGETTVCHFDALTGELLISSGNRSGTALSAKELIRDHAKSREPSLEEPRLKWRHRLFACGPPRRRSIGGLPSQSLPPSSRGSFNGTPTGALQLQVTSISSHRLAAEPIDKLSVYIALYAPDAVLGAASPPQPQGSPAGVIVRLCPASDLAAAVQLMQSRLHSTVAAAQRLVTELWRNHRASYSGRRGHESDAAVVRFSIETRRSLDLLLVQTQQLDARHGRAAAEAIMYNQPLPVRLLQRRKRCQLALHLVGAYISRMSLPDLQQLKSEHRRTSGNGYDDASGGVREEEHENYHQAPPEWGALPPWLALGPPAVTLPVSAAATATNEGDPVVERLQHRFSVAGASADCTSPEERHLASQSPRPLPPASPSVSVAAAMPRGSAPVGAPWAPNPHDTRRYSNPASVEAGNQHGRAVIGDGGGAGPQRSMAAATTLTRRPSLQHTTQGGDSYDDHVTALTQQLAGIAATDDSRSSISPSRRTRASEAGSTTSSTAKRSVRLSDGSQYGISDGSSLPPISSGRMRSPTARRVVESQSSPIHRGSMYSESHPSPTISATSASQRSPDGTVFRPATPENSPSVGHLAQTRRSSSAAGEANLPRDDPLLHRQRYRRQSDSYHQRQQEQRRQQRQQQQQEQQQEDNRSERSSVTYRSVRTASRDNRQLPPWSSSSSTKGKTFEEAEEYHTPPGSIAGSIGSRRSFISRSSMAFSHTTSMRGNSIGGPGPRWK